MLKQISILPLALALLPAVSYGQAKAPAGRETMTVQYVEVPVSVVGRDGNPVRGLTKSNFELYEGRKRIDVAACDVIDFASPESIRANAALPAAHRSFLLLFDLGYSSPTSIARAQSAARTFVQKNVLPGDLVGVATLDVQRGYKLVSNFTSDRGAVAAAIERPASYRAADPLQLAGASSISKRDIDEVLDANKDNPNPKAGMAVAQMAEVMRHARQSDDQFERQQVHRELDWLAQLAASLRGLRGRTQIVFLSEGFDARTVTGRSAKDKNETNEDVDLILSRQWYKVDTDRMFGSSATLTAWDVMTQAFRGSGIVLHAIDLRGLRTQADLSHGVADDNDDALFLLARPTGGTVFKNSNDIAGSFARMLHEQEVVYVLGFQTTATSPGKLHDLSLKLNGGPRGATLVYRRGYFEEGSAPTPFERTLSAAEIIVKDIPRKEIGVAVLAVAFPGTGERAQVPVVVDVSGPDLLKSAKGNDVAAELFIYAFDEQGTVRDRVYQRLALDAAKVGDKLRENGVKYIATLELPPGKYAIKTLVRTPSTEEAGYVRNDVVVPKSGETALLPPFVLDDPHAWLIVRGSEHEGQSYPFQINGEPFVPSAAGHPPAGAVRKVAVFVWNAQPEELTWETAPPSTLLAQVKSAAATKLVLQVDQNAGERFGITVRKRNAAAPLSASTPLIHR
jgi:VWFA-related protein